MERTLHLAVTVTPDLEVGGFVARAVDVEVASQGETRQEALDALTEALELYFEDESEDAVERLSTGTTTVAEIDIRLPA
ncbi:type II toxin-antitoxin system HicB family antitoxin [Nocardiopsis sp. NPDC058631]|uniref:type II toxin-antitoxin system HicB family antitoxin n=1 Tax=Nocardiopsis sp. NPDC058631 TaxID=3346566 RepID=UPI003667929A